MMDDTQPQDGISQIDNLLSKLDSLPPETKPLVNELVLTISNALNVPLQAVNKITGYLNDNALSPRQQKELVNKIHYLSTESLTVLTRLTQFSQLTTAPDNQNTEQVSDINYLVGVKTLLVDDDAERQQKTLERLTTLGLNCATSTLAETWLTLQQAALQQLPYQIIVVSAEHFDHHVAYLGRTLKSSPLFQAIMPVLALAGEKILDFEVERAHFSGYACVLNQRQDFVNKLAGCWQSWSIKTASKQTHSHRILIVEDEPIAQRSAQHQLSKLGFTSDIAPNGRSALNLLETKYYDLIFMDIGLPDISGLEVTAEIRRREQGAKPIPIIGLTIYALEEDKQQGLNVGMNDYLIKPLKENHLQEILQKWLHN